MGNGFANIYNKCGLNYTGVFKKGEREEEKSLKKSENQPELIIYMKLF